MTNRLSLLTVIVALLCGCETAPGPAAEGGYVPPLAEAGVLATITGSRTSGEEFLEGEHTGQVLMIDSKLVRDSHDAWSKSIALAPGRHSIVAKYDHAHYMSQAFLTFEAKAGSAYQLAIKNGTEPPDEQRYCEFWIVDLATGRPVTEVLRRHVSGGSPQWIFGVP